MIRFISSALLILMSLTMPVACQESEREIWHMTSEVRLNLDFTQVGGFYILNNDYCLIIRWGAESRLCIVSLETGDIVMNVRIGDPEIDDLEKEIVKKLPCRVREFHLAAIEGTPRLSYEALFHDHGQTYIGWHLKVFLMDTSGQMHEDQIGVVSRLQDDYKLVGHRVLIPSGVRCDDGRLTTRFDLRSRNAIWKDTVYLQRHSDVVVEDEPVYELKPISLSTEDEMVKFSDYLMNRDNFDFWHSMPDPFDMTAYYGFSFVSDSACLLCNTGNDTRLYYCDTRAYKYELDAEPFTKLWSFEKAKKKMYYTTSKHNYPQSTRTLYVSDLNGRTLTKKSFVSDHGAAIMPYYWHAIAWNQKFYTVFRIGDEYFLQIWEALLD